MKVFEIILTPPQRTTIEEEKKYESVQSIKLNSTYLIVDE